MFFAPIDFGSRSLVTGSGFFEAIQSNDPYDSPQASNQSLSLLNTAQPVLFFFRVFGISVLGTIFLAGALVTQALDPIFSAPPLSPTDFSPFLPDKH